MSGRDNVLVPRWALEFMLDHGCFADDVSGLYATPKMEEALEALQSLLTEPTVLITPPPQRGLTMWQFKVERWATRQGEAIAEAFHDQLQDDSVRAELAHDIAEVLMSRLPGFREE